jgi:hypothetical protein
VRFKTVFKALLHLALASSIVDFALTLYGFSRFIAFWEVNPYITFLMRFINPYLAATLVFSITLIFLVVGYALAKSCLSIHPYSGSLMDVARYLWNSEDIRTIDISIFALTALYAYLTYIHATGALSWITLLSKIAR